jgi:hypothetical protein
LTGYLIQAQSTMRIEVPIRTSPGLPSAAGEASLFAAVVSPTSGIRRDRMSDQTIKGSTDWVYREFVADIPSDGRRIPVGFWMEGKGQLLVRDMQVEKVSKKVPPQFPGEPRSRLRSHREVDPD